MAPGDADKSRANLQSRDALRRLHGAHDRLHRAVDIDHDALAEAVRRGLANPDDINAAAGSHLSDGDADLRRTYVDGDEHRLLSYDPLRSLQGSIPSNPSSLAEDSGKLTDSATALEEVASDDRHVLENAPSEREERHEVQVDSQSVAEERQARGEESIRVEAGQEDASVEVSLELGPKGAEQ